MPEQKAVASARWPSLSRTPASAAGRYTSATRLPSSRLRLPQQEVDDPTATHMRARLSQMDEDSLVSAAGIFESVGEHREAVSVERAGWKGSLLVGSRRECRHSQRPP